MASFEGSSWKDTIRSSDSSLSRSNTFDVTRNSSRLLSQANDMTTNASYHTAPLSSGGESYSSAPQDAEYISSLYRTSQTNDVPINTSYHTASSSSGVESYRSAQQSVEEMEASYRSTRYEPPNTSYHTAPSSDSRSWAIVPVTKYTEEATPYSGTLDIVPVTEYTGRSFSSDRSSTSSGEPSVTDSGVESYRSAQQSVEEMEASYRSSYQTNDVPINTSYHTAPSSSDVEDYLSAQQSVRERISTLQPYLTDKAISVLSSKSNIKEIQSMNDEKLSTNLQSLYLQLTHPLSTVLEGDKEGSSSSSTGRSDSSASYHSVRQSSLSSVESYVSAQQSFVEEMEASYRSSYQTNDVPINTSYHTAPSSSGVEHYVSAQQSLEEIEDSYRSTRHEPTITRHHTPSGGESYVSAQHILNVLYEKSVEDDNDLSSLVERLNSLRSGLSVPRDEAHLLGSGIINAAMEKDSQSHTNWLPEYFPSRSDSGRLSAISQEDKEGLSSSSTVRSDSSASYHTATASSGVEHYLTPTNFTLDEEINARYRSSQTNDIPNSASYHTATASSGVEHYLTPTNFMLDEEINARYRSSQTNDVPNSASYDTASSSADYSSRLKSKSEQIMQSFNEHVERSGLTDRQYDRFMTKMDNITSEIDAYESKVRTDSEIKENSASASKILESMEKIETSLLSGDLSSSSHLSSSGHIEMSSHLSSSGDLSSSSHLSSSGHIEMSSHLSSSGHIEMSSHLSSSGHIEMSSDSNLEKFESSQQYDTAPAKYKAFDSRLGYEEEVRTSTMPRETRRSPREITFDTSGGYSRLGQYYTAAGEHWKKLHSSSGNTEGFQQPDAESREASTNSNLLSEQEKLMTEERFREMESDVISTLYGQKRSKGITRSIRSGVSKLWRTAVANSSRKRSQTVGLQGLYREFGEPTRDRSEWEKFKIETIQEETNEALTSDEALQRWNETPWYRR